MASTTENDGFNCLACAECSKAGYCAVCLGGRLELQQWMIKAIQERTERLRNRFGYSHKKKILETKIAILKSKIQPLENNIISKKSKIHDYRRVLGEMTKENREAKQNSYISSVIDQDVQEIKVLGARLQEKRTDLDHICSELKEAQDMLLIETCNVVGIDNRNEIFGIKQPKLESLFRKNKNKHGLLSRGSSSFESKTGVIEGGGGSEEFNSVLSYFVVVYRVVLKYMNLTDEVPFILYLDGHGNSKINSIYRVNCDVKSGAETKTVKSMSMLSMRQKEDTDKYLGSFGDLYLENRLDEKKMHGNLARFILGYSMLISNMIYIGNRVGKRIPVSGNTDQKIEASQVTDSSDEFERGIASKSTGEHGVYWDVVRSLREIIEYFISREEIIPKYILYPDFYGVVEQTIYKVNELCKIHNLKGGNKSIIKKIMGINGLYASRKYYNQCEGPKSNTKSTTKPKLNRGIHAAECFRKTRDVYGHSHRSHNTGSGNGIDTNINKRVDDTVKNANNTKYKSLKNISKSRVNGDRNNTKGNEEKERGEDNKKYDKYGDYDDEEEEEEEEEEEDYDDEDDDEEEGWDII